MDKHLKWLDYQRRITSLIGAGIYTKLICCFKEITIGHNIEITWLEWLFQHQPINIFNESNFRFNLDGNWWNPITSLHAYEWSYVNWWCVTTVWRDERCNSKIDRDGNAACKTKWRAKFEAVGWRRSRGRPFLSFLWHLTPSADGWGGRHIIQSHHYFTPGRK